MTGEAQRRQSPAGVATRRQARYVRFLGAVGLLACAVVLFDGFRVAQGRLVECHDPASTQVNCFVGGNVTLGLGIAAGSVAVAAVILLGMLLASSLLGGESSARQD